MVKDDEGEMLTLDTHHPPKGKEHRSLFFLSFGEPPKLSPTSPTPKTIKQNFSQLIPESSLKAPNSELRAYEEAVQSMFKEYPMYNTQISKGECKDKSL